MGAAKQHMPIRVVEPSRVGAGRPASGGTPSSVGDTLASGGGGWRVGAERITSHHQAAAEAPAAAEQGSLPAATEQGSLSEQGSLPQRIHS